MALQKDVCTIMKEYSYDYEKMAKLFNQKPKIIEDWIVGKILLSEEDLANIESYLNEFILSSNYRDCSGLLFLQDLLFYNSSSGDYDLEMKYLFSSSKVVKLYPRIFQIRKDSFNFLVCRILQRLGMLKCDHIGLDTYRLVITKAGLAYLIRDRLEQSKRFDELNDESIAIYLSKVEIEGD